LSRRGSWLDLLIQTFEGGGTDWSARLTGLYAFLIAANLAAWAWAFWSFRERPVMLGTALLAYSLGLRHAVDADHIAAIDNITRKLMQEGKRPTSVGFWFAFGHSLVLFLAAFAIAAASNTLPSRFGSLLAPWTDVGAIVRTSVSTLFLFVVAGMNLIILAGVWRTFRRARRDGEFAMQDSGTALNTGGVLARLLRPVFRLVTKDWHMLPLGFLFGLSFDTASEIGLLGISGTETGEGMPVWLIMVFPALFAAGMALIDTTDGVLMLGAYNWAFIDPRRKLYYNFVITAVSVTVAVLIGGVEALSLAGDELGLQGKFWQGVSALNGNFNALGLAIIGVFVLAWIACLIVYRYGGAGASGASAVLTRKHRKSGIWGQLTEPADPSAFPH
jgi:nickel/cobalt transporter (NiCoT) family protein